MHYFDRRRFWQWLRRQAGVLLLAATFSGEAAAKVEWKYIEFFRIESCVLIADKRCAVFPGQEVVLLMSDKRELAESKFDYRSGRAIKGGAFIVGGIFCVVLWIAWIAGRNP